MQLDNTTPRSSQEAARLSARRMLAELAELTGGSPDQEPVLELQFEDILTRTALVEDGKVALLSIVAFLPRTGQPLHDIGFSSDMLWDADNGRHVLLRTVPAIELQDERSLMDAILAVYDDAKAWMEGNGDDELGD